MEKVKDKRGNSTEIEEEKDREIKKYQGIRYRRDMLESQDSLKAESEI